MLNRNTYPIQESEFERLINAGAGLKEWSRRFLLISLGAFIVVLAKAIDFLIRYNYIDDRRQINKVLQAGITSFIEDKRTEEIKNEVEKTSAEIAAQYRGPTRIYYELADRVHKNLPLPIYLCEGGGKVVVDIEVDRKGLVISSTINESETVIVNECLYQAAKNAASLSTFNTDYSAPNKQSGKITYHFAAQ